jgi:hypothetical protein
VWRSCGRYILSGDNKVLLLTPPAHWFLKLLSFSAAGSHQNCQVMRNSLLAIYLAALQLCGGGDFCTCWVASPSYVTRTSTHTTTSWSDNSIAKPHRPRGICREGCTAPHSNPTRSLRPSRCPAAYGANPPCVVASFRSTPDRFICLRPWTPSSPRPGRRGHGGVPGGRHPMARLRRR